MTQASLAYRKNEDAILRGDVPEKYTRLLPFIPGNKILEIGSAEGVLALLLANSGKHVLGVEKSKERMNAARALQLKWVDEGVVGGHASWLTSFYCCDIAEQPLFFQGKDTLVAVRMIYYLRDNLDKVFAEVAKHIPNVVLCGNRNRANRFRNGVEDEPGGPHNFYASREGMRNVLERHGYEIVAEVKEGDEIVVGKKCIG